MTSSATGEGSATSRGGRSGWIEAALFVLTISVLNLSYVGAHAVGAHPVVFIVYAMLIAAATLVAVTGPGPDAVRIISAPQSWLVGSGIIGMEAFYFLLIWYVTPAEASVLTRLAVPVSMAMGLSLGVRTPSAGEVLGALIVTAGVLWMVIGLDPSRVVAGVSLAFASAFVMCMRTFATEFHPWNRRAQTVVEKMRITGLVLAVTSSAGALLVVLLMALAHVGILHASHWLPTLDDFLHLPTLLVSVLVGAAVLTAMQYLAFSSVVKIGTGNFIAVTAFTPLATLIAQELATACGVLRPMPVDWRIWPAMAVVISGVFVLLLGARAKMAARQG
ncbi:MAG: hypothetical protein ACM31O_07890 [Bacteroidota bacterium]